MPDYSKGKIYQIISPNHPVPYIGSTTQALSQRMGGHMRKRNTTSRVVIEAGGAYIELIEEFPCQNKEQLNKREGEIIRGRECVNMMVPGRTPREYREENRDVLAERMKQYHEANKEVITERKKQYYEAHKEAIIEKQKRYYEAHKETLNEWQKQYNQARKAQADA